MEIKRLGFNYCHPSSFQINRPNGSGDFLLLIIKTEAFVVQNGERISVPQNSALIFKKGTPQFYGALGDKYINDWIHFELSEGGKVLFAELGIPFDTVLPLRETGELSSFIKRIFIEQSSQNMHKNAVSQRYFELLLYKISEKIQGQSQKYEHPLYSQFYKLHSEIMLEPQNDWSIDLICKKMMLSRSHIQHLYKSFFGTSILSDVQKGRIEYAEYLLASTDMTVTAISHSCGYESDVHFMRLFKKATGITPSDFRKNNLK